MTLNETLKQLKALGNEQTRAHNTKYGAGDNQFGVKHGDIRVLAKKIRSNHDLAMPLWETGNADAQLLATLLITPKTQSADEVDRMVRSVTFAHVTICRDITFLAAGPASERSRYAAGIGA